jgi:retron-type reverse transcriptase
VGLWDALRRLFRRGGDGHGVEELARRLGVSAEQLLGFRPAYRSFSVPKRSGGTRHILAPEDGLKALQRRIARRLLGRLACHPAAMGFERGRSIVVNALGHVGQAVVVGMDLKDFFGSTAAERVRRYFRAVGWGPQASEALARLCTHEGGLPQGAPTSPRLSNLVNTRLDARLDGLARRLGCVYTRYADDLTFSFAADDPRAVHVLIRLCQRILAGEGYALHRRKKLRIARRHDRQLVTGLVVNQRINLPRRTRRWLRAVAHHLSTGRPASLTAEQLAGWRALQAMVAGQAGTPGPG